MQPTRPTLLGGHRGDRALGHFHLDSSGATRMMIASSLIERMMPRMPPAVVTRSPVLMRREHLLPLLLPLLLRDESSQNTAPGIRSSGRSMVMPLPPPAGDREHCQTGCHTHPLLARRFRSRLRRAPGSCRTPPQKFVSGNGSHPRGRLRIAQRRVSDAVPAILVMYRHKSSYRLLPVRHSFPFGNSASGKPLLSLIPTGRNPQKNACQDKIRAARHVSRCDTRRQSCKCPDFSAHFETPSCPARLYVPQRLN